MVPLILGNHQICSLFPLQPGTKELPELYNAQLGLFWVILGLLWVIFGYIGVILGYMGLYWAILGYIGLYGVIRGYIGLYGVIWGYIGLYWVILGLCWVILGLCRDSGKGNGNYYSISGCWGYVGIMEKMKNYCCG